MPVVTKRKTVKKKKATKKVAKKRPVKKRPVKKRAKKSTRKRRGKVGLRTPQIRVLEVLARANRGLNRSEISWKSDVDVSMLSRYIGSHDPDKRARNDKKMTSLLTLKLVAFAPEEEEGGGQYYKITAAGRKAVK